MEAEAESKPITVSYPFKGKHRNTKLDIAPIHSFSELQAQLSQLPEIKDISLYSIFCIDGERKDPLVDDHAWKTFKGIQGKAKIQLLYNSPPQSSIASRADVEEKDQFVHEGVRCDKCGGAPITGTRYKCEECADFDLCPKCYLLGKHDPAHSFFRMNCGTEQYLAERGVNVGEQIAKVLHPLSFTQQRQREVEKCLPKIDNKIASRQCQALNNFVWKASESLVEEALLLFASLQSKS